MREYGKAVQMAMMSLRKQELSFLSAYRFQLADIHTDMLKVNPSPTGTKCFIQFICTKSHIKISFRFIVVVLPLNVFFNQNVKAIRTLMTFNCNF